MLFKKTRSSTQEKLKREKYRIREEKGMRVLHSSKPLGERSIHYHWTYLAYFLSISGMLMCGFFTILYTNDGQRWLICLYIVFEKNLVKPL